LLCGRNCIEQALPYIERGLTPVYAVGCSCNIGGFTEAMKSRRLVQPNGIDLMPHNPLSARSALVASIHLAARGPEFHLARI
jgi:L-alanine-DL-glutamate epimerase-like enolase superfamily enzyme